MARNIWIGIREVTSLYDKEPGARSPVLTNALSTMSDTQRSLYDLLGLESHRAK